MTTNFSSSPYIDLFLGALFVVNGIEQYQTLQGKQKATPITSPQLLFLLKYITVTTVTTATVTTVTITTVII